MKRFHSLLLAGACFCGSAGPALATTESQAAVLFLLIEPGARGIAMGESYVAIADDATASYFNPAALAGQNRKKLNLTYMKWLPEFGFDDMYYSFLAYSQPVPGWGNIGINATLMNLGEQQRTDERGQLGEPFSSYDAAVSGAFGADVGDHVSAGIGLKFIRSNLADQGAGLEQGKGVGNSFAADLGMLWRLSPALTFGAALRNLGPKIAYIDASQADPLPQHVVAGLAYKLLDTEYNDVLLSLDLYKPLIADGSFATNLIKAWTDDKAKDEIREMDLHVGGEYKYGLSKRADDSFFAMRGGYSMDRDGELNLWTVGVGLRYNIFQFDVAYIIGEDTPVDNNTRFSINMMF